MTPLFIQLVLRQLFFALPTEVITWFIILDSFLRNLSKVPSCIWIEGLTKSKIHSVILPTLFIVRLFSRLHGSPDRHIPAHEYVPCLKDPVAIPVGDVVVLLEEAVAVDPGVCADDGAVLQPLLFSILAVLCLVFEKSFGTLVGLDVVLGVREVVPIGVAHNDDVQ